MKNYDHIDFRLAVIVGEQSRAVSFNIDNLTCFFNLLKIPYDFFICTDDASQWKDVKNIKSLILYQDIKQNDREMYERVTLPHMGISGYQFIRCNHAVDSMKEPHIYTHMMKLRTDSIYMFRNLIHRAFPNIEINKITIEHVDRIRNILTACLKKMHHDQSICVAGDKFAIGSFDAVNTWLRAFTEPRIMKNVYAQYHGPDFTASNKIIKETEISLNKSVVYEKQWYNPIHHFMLTRFTGIDNSVLKRVNDTNVNIGVRMNKSVNTQVWQNNQLTAKCITNLLNDRRAT